MKVRLAIMITLFAVVAGGIWGYTTYLESQKPKGDPSRPEATTGSSTAAPDAKGGSPLAPPA